MAVLDRLSKHSSLDRILCEKNFPSGSRILAIWCAYLRTPKVTMCSSYRRLIFSRNSVVWGLFLVWYLYKKRIISRNEASRNETVPWRSPAVELEVVDVPGVDLADLVIGGVDNGLVEVHQQHQLAVLVQPGFVLFTQGLGFLKCIELVRA